jgi:hypothetical protein
VAGNTSHISFADGASAILGESTWRPNVAGKRKRKLQGVAAPSQAREPLFIRACSAFVNNLSLILRVAFIAGAAWLAGEFRDFTDDLPTPVADAEPVPVQPEVELTPVAEPAEREPVITDRVQHYLDCTFGDYRVKHYAECVEEPSEVYQWPEPGPDDTGYIPGESPVILAGLTDA